MLKNIFHGKLAQIGTERLISRWFNKRSYIKIGKHKIHNVVVSDAMCDQTAYALKTEQEVTLHTGWLFIYRWLLCIKNTEETTRQSIILFLVGLFLHLLTLSFVLNVTLLFTYHFLPELLATFIALAGCILIITSIVINIKAWLGK